MPGMSLSHLSVLNNSLNDVEVVLQFMRLCPLKVKFYISAAPLCFVLGGSSHLESRT